MQRKVICLMGPTASGKTPLAIALANHLPCEIVSVDSAMIYRGMDIGTAKPTADVLQRAPHRLIDLRDPAEHYSVGQFREDAYAAINDITARHHVPLLVGGTMMYFKTLQRGIATLPQRDPKLRAALQARAEREGWEALHHALATVDPGAAQKIHPRDGQRIQRALEVFMLTGQPISAAQAGDTHAQSDITWINLAIAPTDRAILHDRIAKRFQAMLDQGFVEEVRRLYERGDLTLDMPSIRAVGYRQVWDYLAGQLSYDEMRDKAVSATRQLAKRQLTWLRAWPDLVWYDSESKTLCQDIIRDLASVVGH